MSVRSFSHVGITVSDFNAAVRFYWDVFGCPLVGVADTPPERVRAFFGVDAPTPSLQDRLDPRAGRRRARDLRLRAEAAGRGHPVEPRRPDALLLQRARTCRSGTTTSSAKGVEIVTPPERSPRGHSFFFVRDFDGNLIELMDLGYMYHVLEWLGPLGGWLFRRGMYKQYYLPAPPA